MRRAVLCFGLLALAGCSGLGAGRPKPVATTAQSVTTRTTTASVPPTTSSPVIALPAGKIVLGLEDLNALAGQAQYRVGPDLADMAMPLSAGGQVDPQECAPALRGLQSRSVAGGGTVSFRAVEAVTVGDASLPDEKRRKDDFVQVAAVYPGEDEAGRVFGALASGVGSCRERAVLDVEPGEEVKTQYTVTGVQTSAGRARWTQHRADWGENQKCVLEARLVRNVVLQDIECGVSTEDAAVGQLLAKVLDETTGRIR